MGSRRASRADREHFRRIADASGPLPEDAPPGSPAEAGRRLRERNAAFADRTTLMLYDETGDRDAVVDLLRAASGGA